MPTLPVDPDGWAAELRNLMLESERLHLLAEGDEARRRNATITMGLLFQRLEQVPGLKGLMSLKVCRDSFDFLDDLHRGRDHPWRSLGPFGGLQKYTKRDERARALALVGVAMLIDAAGETRGAKKLAFEQVSRMAIAAGHDLSPARIKGLHYEYEAGRFPHPELVKVIITDFWMGEGDRPSALCDHGDPIHRCGPSGGGRCADIEATTQSYLGSLFQNA